MNADLQSIYAPIEPDLREVADLLRRETAGDDPYVGELVGHVLSGQGKMIRPALALLSSAACGGADEQRFLLGGAVELLHVASLVHDDIIDAADLRRGISTVNVVWGNQAAVLLGDYLFATAFTLMGRIAHPGVAPAIAEAAVQMSRAEIVGLQAGGEMAGGESTYLSIIEGKTAYLFSAACRAGALVAGAGARLSAALGEFGLQWGMAFQITDDTLDLVGDRGSMGKPVGSDIEAGKATLPMIVAWNKASEPDRERLEAFVSDPAAAGSLGDLRSLLERYGAIEASLDAARAFADRAVLALGSVQEGSAKASLLGLTSFVLDRSR